METSKESTEATFFLQASAQWPEHPLHKLACYLKMPQTSFFAAQPSELFSKQWRRARKA